MKKAVDPVMAEYAKEIGAEQIAGEDQRAVVKPEKPTAGANAGVVLLRCSNFLR